MLKSLGRQKTTYSRPLLLYHCPFLTAGCSRSAETSQRPGEHADEVHPPLHTLHQAQRDQEAPGLGGEPVGPWFHAGPPSHLVPILKAVVLHTFILQSQPAFFFMPTGVIDKCSLFIPHSSNQWPLKALHNTA